MLDNRNSGRNGAAQPISGRKPADASHIRAHFPGENGGARIWTPTSGVATTYGRASCKQIQINPRKNPCICLDSFGRIRTFQRVMAEKTKKIWFGLNSRLRLCVGGPNGLSKGALPGRAPSPISGMINSTDFRFCQYGINIFWQPDCLFSSECDAASIRTGERRAGKDLVCSEWGLERPDRARDTPDAQGR
jgi:hypothetical protein